jgi:hypothetical protein
LKSPTGAATDLYARVDDRVRGLQRLQPIGVGLAGQRLGRERVRSGHYFAQSGTQTLRVEVKEDGFSIDQVVLSADTYHTSLPGTSKNDTTILPR